MATPRPSLVTIPIMGFAILMSSTTFGGAVLYLYLYLYLAFAILVSSTTFGGALTVNTNTNTNTNKNTNSD